MHNEPCSNAIEHAADGPAAERGSAAAVGCDDPGAVGPFAQYKSKSSETRSFLRSDGGAEGGSSQELSSAADCVPYSDISKPNIVGCDDSGLLRLRPRRIGEAIVPAPRRMKPAKHEVTRVVRCNGLANGNKIMLRTLLYAKL